jgi:hypothetical protein
MAGAGAEDGGTNGKRIAIAPVERSGTGGVDIDDDKVAVGVEARDGADDSAPIRECHSDLVTPEVVGVGQDLAGRQDDTRTTGAASDPDDGWADALRDGTNGGLEVFDGGHEISCAPVRLLAAIDLQLAIYY